MKITLIALHYGEEGSGGARRSYLWAKGLRQAGHQVHVVSPYVNDENPDDLCLSFPNRDSTFRNDSFAKPSLSERLIKRHLRVWLRWPDPEIIWHRKSVSATIDHVKSCDWLITSSPPESAHAIGPQLAKALGAKWCAEFRDSWIEHSHRPYVKGLRAVIEKALAKRWLKQAHAVTAVDEQVLREAKAYAPNAEAAKIGHFSEPFIEEPFSLPPHDFNLVHAGGFERSDKNRKLSKLLQALRPIATLRPDLHLHLMGPLTLQETVILEKTDIQFTHHGWVELSKSRAIQAASDAVLLYAPFKRSTALPGKYAEYCNLRKPIVFLGPEHIKNKAHRREEFLTLADLATYPKGQITPIEKDATVDKAVMVLTSLLQLASVAHQ